MLFTRRCGKVSFSLPKSPTAGRQIQKSHFGEVKFHLHSPRFFKFTAKTLKKFLGEHDYTNTLR